MKKASVLIEMQLLLIGCKEVLLLGNHGYSSLKNLLWTFIKASKKNISRKKIRWDER